MNKFYNRIIVLLIALAGLGGFTSCDDYLDETPDNRQEVKKLSDVAELLVSAYSEATYNFIEWRTDNVEANNQLSQEKWLSQNYRFEVITDKEDQDSPSYLWAKTYNAIAHSNEALEALENIDENNDNLRNAIKGEALMTRAYNHFILASVFCQAYDANTANKELGIPYITSPEKALKVVYNRGTLQDTYNMIEKDILEGLPLVSDDFYTGTGKYHINTGAAYAIASRFFLWKGDYENCIKYSNMLLGDGVINGSYCRDFSEVFTGNSPEDLANNFINPESLSNLLLVRKETSYVTRYYKGYQATANIFDEIYGHSAHGANDARKAQWGYSTLGAYAPPKYTELFRYTTQTTGFPYFIMNELRAEEVVLNRMEAYVKTGRLADALADYNVYAPTRYSGGGGLKQNEVTSYYGGTDEEAMMLLIIDERRKEFMREGMRWWDIKRYKMAIKHKDIQGDTFELAEDDLKKAVQIPAKAISNGIEANPR